MGRYRNQGIGDFIPTAGEGRALVEVKGKVGRMKGFRRNNLRAVRQGRSRRQPQIWIPLAAGSQTSVAERTEQVWARRVTNGSTDEAIPDEGWLWVISPERVGGNSNFSVVAMSGEIDEEMQYTVVGMSGHLRWTPMFSLADPNTDPAAWSGFIRLYWYKVRAIPDQSGSQTPAYPWSGSWDDPTDSGPTHVLGFVPPYGTLSVNNQANQKQLILRDPRYRAKIIRHVDRSWVLPHIPTTYFSTDENVPHSEYFPVAARPVELPLPRKLVCKVGRGESLACAYQIVSQSGQGTGSAPTGQFDFTDVKIKVYASV